MEETTPMTKDEKVIRAKVGLLELAPVYDGESGPGTAIVAVC